MAKTRRRFKQELTLQERLALWSKEVAATIEALPLGPERDELIKKARQAEVAVRLDDWSKSSGAKSAE